LANQQNLYVSLLILLLVAGIWSSSAAFGSTQQNKTGNGSLIVHAENESGKQIKGLIADFEFEDTVSKSFTPALFDLPLTGYGKGYVAFEHLDKEELVFSHWKDTGSKDMRRLVEFDDGTQKMTAVFGKISPDCPSFEATGLYQPPLTIETKENKTEYQFGEEITITGKLSRVALNEQFGIKGRLILLDEAIHSVPLLIQVINPFNAVYQADIVYAREEIGNPDEYYPRDLNYNYTVGINDGSILGVDGNYSIRVSFYDLSRSCTIAIRQNDVALEYHSVQLDNKTFDIGYSFHGGYITQIEADSRTLYVALVTLKDSPLTITMPKGLLEQMSPDDPEHDLAIFVDQVASENYAVHVGRDYVTYVILIEAGTEDVEIVGTLLL
jgi:hypothetical protein